MPLPISTALRDYTIEWCKPNRVDLRRVTIADRHLCRILGDDSDAATLKRRDFRRYTEKRRDEGAADPTIRRELGVLSAALRHAVKEERLDGTPMIELPDDSPPIEQALTEDQAKALCESGLSPRALLFVMLGLGTAARATAIMQLTWDRVDFEKRTIDFRVPGAVYKKKRRAKVPMPTWIEPALLEMRGEPTATVISEGPSIYRELKAAFAALGIPVRQPQHILRHTFVTWALKSNVKIHKVALIAADRVATIEKRYSHVPLDGMRDAVDFNQPQEQSA